MNSRQLAQAAAEQEGISIYRASVIVTDLCYELEVRSPFSAKQVNEILFLVEDLFASGREVKA